MKSEAKPRDWLRLSILLYFFLLIFEGALRKWVIPGLSNPLLIIRDPVAVMIYILASQRKLFPSNGFMTSAMLLAGFSFLASLAVDNPFIVTVYGFRCNFLHFPMIFVIAAVYNHDDVIKLGKWILWISIPMGALVAAQFFLPPSSFVNAGAGGEGTQMALGTNHVRAAGTFSYGTGVSQFFGLSTAFLIFGFLGKNIYSRKVLITAMGLTILAVMLSGSRTAVASVIIVVVVSLVGSMLSGKGIAGGIWFILVGVILLGVIGSLGMVQQGKQLLGDRFGDAKGIKTGFFGRAIEGFTQPFDEMWDQPALGKGLGAGTIAGIKLMNTEEKMLWVESEWPRLFYESGPILGLAMVFLRIILAAYITWQSWLSCRRGNPLPMAICAAGIFLLLNGTWAQPTTLGFSVVISGLCLASMRVEKLEDLRQAGGGDAVPPKFPVRSPRKMSVHAMRLHGLESKLPQPDEPEKNGTKKEK